MVLELTITSSLHREKTRQRHIGTRKRKRETGTCATQQATGNRPTRKNEKFTRRGNNQERSHPIWVFHSYNCQMQICMMGKSRIDSASASASRSAFSSHAPAPAPDPCVVFVFPLCYNRLPRRPPFLRVVSVGIGVVSSIRPILSPERASARNADWAPGPGVFVLFPPVARNLT